MTDRPIIFSAPMLKALLDGMKTQTRRILKPQPVPSLSWSAPPPGTYPSDKGWSRFPYAPGDRLWVREAWRHDAGVPFQYRAGPHIGDDALGIRWLSPIHMPRKFSRLTLTVTDVRVQRVQDISNDDAIAEGIQPHGHAYTGYGKQAEVWMAPYDSFASLWNSIHGPGAWDANPWVCALTFTVEQRNIDA